jgi:hypothetical protein
MTRTHALVSVLDGALQAAGGRLQELLRVLLLLQERGTKHELLGRIPNHITQRIGAIHLQQVAQDGEEAHLVRSVAHLELTSISTV